MARGLLSEEQHRQVDALLATAPSAGAVIRGTGGVRKLRVALGGRGKRGGARVIYYYRGSRERIYLIAVYPKSAKISLTGAEKMEMRRLTTLLEAE